jgi:hypothetical protein
MRPEAQIAANQKRIAELRTKLNRIQLGRIPSEPRHAQISVGLHKAADKYLSPNFGEALAIGLTAQYTNLVDMAKKNPALFIPVKVG